LNNAGGAKRKRRQGCAKTTALEHTFRKNNKAREPTGLSNKIAIGWCAKIDDMARERKEAI
jgi:hypothetical protein